MTSAATSRREQRHRQLVGCHDQGGVLPEETGAVGQVLGGGPRKERKGRKSFIEGELVAEDGAVHATLDGITVEVSREKLSADDN